MGFNTKTVFLLPGVALELQTKTDLFLRFSNAVKQGRFEAGMRVLSKDDPVVQKWEGLNVVFSESPPAEIAGIAGAKDRGRLLVS